MLHQSLRFIAGEISVEIQYDDIIRSSLIIEKFRAYNVGECYLPIETFSGLEIIRNYLLGTLPTLRSPIDVNWIDVYQTANYLMCYPLANRVRTILLVTHPMEYYWLSAVIDIPAIRNAFARQLYKRLNKTLREIPADIVVIGWDGNLGDVFRFAKLSPAQLAKITDGMTASELADFNERYRFGSY